MTGRLRTDLYYTTGIKEFCITEYLQQIEQEQDAVKTNREAKTTESLPIAVNLLEKGLVEIIQLNQSVGRRFLYQRICRLTPTRRP